jgi:hypothetical protein
MTQSELEHELCDLTGESLGEIRRRGFSLVEVAPEEPLSIDWDELQQIEPLRYPPRRRPVRRRVAA